MAAPMIAPLPPGIVLSGDYTVRFTALDPTTGATVSGVTVSGATIQLDNPSGAAPAALQAGPFMLVPGPSS